MLNHSRDRNCYWQVKGSLIDGSASIELKALRRLKPGTEATIAYENESNEAMLFRYGFVDLNNERDMVMIRCPLGPQEEWDDVMRTKVALLRVRPADHSHFWTLTRHACIFLCVRSRVRVCLRARA